MKLVDLNCTGLRFQDGDSVLVKVKWDPNPAQIEKIQNTIRRWARADIEVLVINTERINLEVISQGKTVYES